MTIFVTSLKHKIFFCVSNSKSNKMEVKPYNESGSKKQQVEQMFDNIADSYDFNNSLLSFGIDKLWRKKLVKAIKSQKPRFVLDVATGTADVAIQLVKNIPELKVIGIDISEGMLKNGISKIKNLGLSDKISLEQQDSESLSFENDTFDAVSVAFGVRNFESLNTGLKEILRVLKPGGKLCVLEFSKPVMQPMAGMYKFYFKKILPTIGKITSQDNNAYTYLYESVQVFPEGNDFVKILESTGYQRSKCIKLSLGICSLYTAYK